MILIKKKFSSKRLKLKRKLLKLIFQKKLKSFKKPKLKYKFKYKKPPWTRKLYDNFRTLLWLSSLNLNFFFSVKDKYQILKGFKLRLLSKWKKLYVQYLQYFLGIPKKSLLNFFKNLLVKSRGFWDLLNLLKTQLSFFFLFNFIKKKKIIKFKLLKNGLIRNFNLKTKLKFLKNNNLIKFIIKTNFFYSKSDYYRRFFFIFYKKRIKLRKWQRVKLKTVIKSWIFFKAFKLKKKFTFFLMKNFFFFNFNFSNFIFFNQKNKFFSLKKIKKIFFTIFKNQNKILQSFLIKKSRYLWRFKFVLNLFKRISKKEYWLRSFWSKFKSIKHFIRYQSKKKNFFLYYFFFKKNNIKKKKMDLKFFKKNFKSKALDFNLLQEFNFKDNFFFNFLIKFKKIKFFKQDLNLLIINYKKLKKKKLLNFRLNNFIVFKEKKKIYKINNFNKYKTKNFNKYKTKNFNKYKTKNFNFILNKRNEK